MSAETLALAAEAVADPHWRWLPGMRDTDGRRVRRTRKTFGDHGDVMALVTPTGEYIGPEVAWVSVECMLPDLDDAATLGCLLALVREALGEPRLSTRYGRDREWPWSVESGCDDEIGAVRGKTEAAALVAALLCAP